MSDLFEKAMRALEFARTEGVVNDPDTLLGYPVKEVESDRVFLCGDCHNKLLSLGIELWEYTLPADFLVAGDCYFCGKPAEGMYDRLEFSVSPFGIKKP